MHVFIYSKILANIKICFDIKVNQYCLMPLSVGGIASGLMEACDMGVWF